MMSRFAIEGIVALRLKLLLLDLTSRSCEIVFAPRPLLSLMRFAAVPVADSRVACLRR